MGTPGGRFYMSTPPWENPPNTRHPPILEHPNGRTPQYLKSNKKRKDNNKAPPPPVFGPTVIIVIMSAAILAPCTIRALTLTECKDMSFAFNSLVFNLLVVVTAIQRQRSLLDTATLNGALGTASFSGYKATQGDRCLETILTLIMIEMIIIITLLPN